MDTIDFTAYHRVQWERNFQLAAAVVIVYEYFIHLDHEVNHFWKQRWNFAKILFLWSRYYSTAFNVGNAAVFVNSQVTQELYVQHQLFRMSVDANEFYSRLSRCTKFFFWQNYSSALEYITTQVILQLRLYAMYGKNKKLLVFFIALLCCESTVLGVLFGLKRDGLVGTNNPAPGLFICADADPPNKHWIAYAPTTMLIAETIMLCLALNKAWEHYRDGAGGRIIPWLTKESVYFFIPIFFIHLTTLTLWMINKLTLNELFTGFSFAIPAVLANRLLISIRTYNARTDYLSDIDIPTQGSVILPPSRSTLRRHGSLSFNTAIELTSFHGRGENL